MSYPENPNTIIIKNKYYPNGLREIDVWNYYQKAKRDILKQTKMRDLLFFIMVDLNRGVVRKKIGGQYIRLTPENYDKIITGRTLSIHSTMNSYENFGIIDVDISEGEGIKWAKKATSDVYEYAMDKIPFVDTVTIRFTGKTSFHVVCNFKRKLKIDAIKFLLERSLKEADFSKVYTIGGKRRDGIPNLDLNRNCLRCNYISLHSLSVIGLRCIEVPYNKLLSFDPQNAKV